MVRIIKTKQLVTVKVDYFIPDYQHILNEFLWQTDDYWPDIPRVHMFLNYWKDNIEATINMVHVMNNLNPVWRSIDDLRNI
jgi:uncharacterized protein Usg